MNNPNSSAVDFYFLQHVRALKHPVNSSSRSPTVPSPPGGEIKAMNEPPAVHGWARNGSTLLPTQAAPDAGRVASVLRLCLWWTSGWAAPGPSSLWPSVCSGRHCGEGWSHAATTLTDLAGGTCSPRL